MISVALCTYNGENYIRQQLDSILSQTMPVDEIIVHDDGSHDNTIVILEGYVSKYPQIRLYLNKKNLGYKKNFEEAIKDCHGDYIFFSDQDDIWKADKVNSIISYLKKTGMYGVFTDAHLIDKFNEQIGATLFRHQNLDLFINEGLLDKYMFELLCLKGNFVTGATLAITKTAKDFILPFRTSRVISHDGWIALKLASINKLGFINDTLISYRIHPNQSLGLDFGVDNKKEVLFDCFCRKENPSYLLERMRNTGGILFVCNFTKREYCMLFKSYKFLMDQCAVHSNISHFKMMLSYYYVKLHVFVRSIFGYGLNVD